MRKRVSGKGLLGNLSADTTTTTSTQRSVVSQLEQLENVPPPTKNESIIIEWSKRWSNQEMKGARAMTTPDCKIHFVDAEADMLFSDFCDNMDALIASFPDYTYTWGEVVEKEPGVVHLFDYDSTITHTGAPYSFGGYEPIEAKGTVVHDHIPHIIIKVNEEGIIYSMELNAEGKVVGLPGIYLAIGGIIF